MRNKTLQKNLKHRLSLLLCLMAFLAVGQSAWGTTYYVWGGVSNSKQAPSAMSRLGNTATTSFTITDAAWLSKDVDNYYVIFTTSSDTPASTVFDEGHVNSHIKCAATAQSGSVTAGVQDIYVGNSRYYYLRFSLSANVQSVTISLSNLASSNPTTATYTVSTGGSPTPTTDKWYLAGKFNSWSSTANPFTGSGVSRSCTVYLIAKEYSTTGDEGFKVVKEGSPSTWYGNGTAITRSNSTTPINLTTGGDNFGLTADIDGDYTFTITNLSGNPSLTVGYPPLAPPTYAIARWGAAPTIDGSKNIDASAYVATHGCDGNQDYIVTQLKVRYWKEGDEANSEEQVTDEDEYAPGELYEIEIPYTSNVLMNCTTKSKIIMEVACKNGLGWSAYSDRMAVMYTANHAFETTNLTRSFTACEGSHQFTLSEMVKPVPDSWTVKNSSDADANSEFTLADGEMIWNPGDKTKGEYVYTFTFSKAGGYADKSATLTINYTKTAPEGAVTISASKTTATKYEEVTLTATKGADVAKIKWSVSPDTYITTTNSDGTNATFQGKAIKAYTVTAVGLSASCGETETSNSVTINVSKDTEECNE